MKHCGLGTDYIKPEHTYSVLSRYNGIGSLKISMAQNRRTSNPYISDVSRIDMSTMQKNPSGAGDSSYMECVSIAGQLTNNSNNNTKFQSNNEHKDLSDIKANNITNNQETSQMLNNKLRKQQQHQRLLDKTKFKPKIIQKPIPTIRSTNSIYSMSTISNSSLQEYDDQEMDTTELAKYMRQINNEIRHEKK